MSETLTIAGVRIKVRPLPASKTCRLLPYQHSRENRLSACAAAIGMLWPDGEARAWGAPGDSMIEYGDLVVDDLAARGVSIREIYEAGQVIIACATGGLKFTQKDVKRVEDFTGAPDKA